MNLVAYGTPDAADLAAAYAFGVARAHPFADGDKRTAWVVARLFLADHGHRLSFDPSSAFRLVEGLAAGEVPEAELAEWLRSRLSRS